MENAPGGDAELVCKTLQVEHKLFYFDLKENPRGRYLKISEKTSGSRSTIIVPVAGIVWFVDLFNYYANGEEELSSKELQLDTKVFYFDVGENQRGRFLKVSEASVTRNRSTIIVPAGNAADEGWAAFRNILVEIHEASQLLLPPTASSGPLQQGTSSQEHMGVMSDNVGSGYLPSTSSPIASASTVPLPEVGSSNVGLAGGGLATARVIRAEQKKFFFDLGSNARGQYLRISEVTGVDRSAIILPVAALAQFHETLGQFVEVVKSQGPIGPNVANGQRYAETETII
ncbi:transcription factor Pur-alpha 1 isoform X2 [Physcomitrium patens]|uniref:transcription factor Pur-alpha 1 isoform X2 n=1 Tax=Physcomitrium patens TaxID=3218 RepID=UPI00024ABB5F|nr:transcription factor Pur-alpha 1-like isoform X2 [Physcomitrium patens]|eukprot:XP_024400696.1 transcription factor Pur-alpha 1-like isoform X2 [Physcomitrella patens]